MLQAFNFLVFIDHSCFVLSPSFFLLISFFFLLSFLLFLSFFPPFPSLFISFLSSLLFGSYFFVFCVSLLHPTTTYSFFHIPPCCYLLHLSHSALQLLVASFMFHPNTTRCLPHISPCYYLFPHVSLVATCFFALRLLLPIPSFTLHPTIIYSFLCASPCNYLFFPSHFHLITYLLPPSCFTLLLHAPSFTFHPTITYSFLCALPHNYLFFPFCFALLPTYSFAFHHVVSITNVNAMKLNHLNVHPWFTL